MSIRTVISLAAVAALGIASISTEAFATRAVRGGAVAARGGAVAARGGVAYRGARGGVAYRGGAVAARGGYYGGRYYRRGVGAAAVGAAAVGAAAAAPYYYNTRCGYYPYPSCY